MDHRHAYQGNTAHLVPVRDKSLRQRALELANMQAGTPDDVIIRAQRYLEFMTETEAKPNKAA